MRRKRWLDGACTRADALELLQRCFLNGRHAGPRHKKRFIISLGLGTWGMAGFGQLRGPVSCLCGPLGGLHMRKTRGRLRKGWLGCLYFY